MARKAATISWDTLRGGDALWDNSIELGFYDLEYILLTAIFPATCDPIQGSFNASSVANAVRIVGAVVDDLRV